MAHGCFEKMVKCQGQPITENGGTFSEMNNGALQQAYAREHSSCSYLIPQAPLKTYAHQKTS